jgi:hypothetical protein
LLGLLAHDLPGHDLELSAPGRGRFSPKGEGPEFDVRERVDRRFLGHTEIAQFLQVVEGAPGPSAHLRVRHTGALKRQGIEVVALAGGEDAERLAAQLEGDGSFTAAGLILDFTEFDAVRSDGEWSVAVELMGASFVTLALPPMRSYVRLHPDQRDALLTALAAVDRHLAGS